MNRLARERSPYLLQHAGNPVDWYPWGDEAFARARREDKPIFLSIGYSTCHWCHVMEHESFEDEAIAAPAQPRLRLDQGRSRGAARRRSRLHGVRAGDDGVRRLADDGVPDAGSEAVLRRHLLSRRSRAGAGPGFVDLLGELARVLEGRPAAGRARGRRAVRAAPARRHRPAASRRRAAARSPTPRRSTSPSSSSSGPSTRGAAASARRRSFRVRRSCCSCCASTPAARPAAAARRRRC